MRSSMRGVSGYPRTLCLYRISASRFWQVRLFYAGRLICRSTREETLEPAIAFARWFFDAVTRGEDLPPTLQVGRGQVLDPPVPATGKTVRPVEGADDYPLQTLARQESRRMGASDVQPQQQVVAANEPDPSKVSFRWIAERFMLREAARRDRGEFAELSFRADRIRLDKRILPFLGDEPLGRLDARRLEDFLLGLEAEKLSSTSLSLYLMTLRKVLRYALAQGVITSMPVLPRVRIRKTSRGSFTPSEYFRLLRKARSTVGTVLYQPDWSSATDDTSAKTEQESTPAQSKASEANRPRFWILPKYWKVPPDLPWVISFMVNSFVRPSDIKTLRHRHVEIVRAEHTYLRLTLPETKAHDKPIVTLRPAVRIYETLQSYWRERGLARADDYLFFPGESNRNYALAVLGWMFRQLLEELDLRLGPHGNPRTLYSLRHTAITFRLLYGQGIDILTLARNARTSVEMIEKHYASTLTGERNISMLQSKRTARR